MPFDNIWVMLLLILLVLIPLIVGIVLLFLVRGRRIRCREKATATITKRLLTGGCELQFPHGDTIVKVKARVDNPSNRYQAGDTLSIRYNPQKLREIIVMGYTDRTRRTAGIILVVLSLLEIILFALINYAAH